MTTEQMIVDEYISFAMTTIMHRERIKSEYFVKQDLAAALKEIIKKMEERNFRCFDHTSAYAKYTRSGYISALDDLLKSINNES